MVTNELCYLLVVEKLLNIEVPACAQWIQVLFGEITHILNRKPLASLASPQINPTHLKDLIAILTHIMDVGGLTSGASKSVKSSWSSMNVFSV